MIGFPNGTLPKIAVKDLDLLWKHPNYATKNRIIQWVGGDLEDGDNFETPQQIADAIKERNKEEWIGDLAIWGKGKRFVIAHAVLSEPAEDGAGD